MTAALAALYFVWGSTFVAVMIAIRSLPPFVLSSLRYLLAGMVVLAWARRKEGPLHVSPRELLDSSIVGFGLLAGLGGVALLLGGGGSVALLPAGAIVLSSLVWAACSLYARRTPLGSRPLTSAGLQMLTAAALLAVAGGASGELGHVRPGAISAASAGAVAYLVVAGSLVGYLCYVWLNANAPSTIVSTYAFVNPAVAVLLGSLLLGEPINGRTLLAGAAILVAVILIVAGRSTDEEPDNVVRLPARLPEPALEQAA